MSKTVLILGKGFIGKSLSEHFQKNNLESKCYSREELDYTNKSFLHNTLDKLKTELNCVINCSGYTGKPNVDACETDKENCYNFNVVHPMGVVEVCNNLNIPIIHIGSGCIYSGYDKDYTEKDTPNFGVNSPDASYYSKCKHSFEQFTDNLSRYVLRIRIPFTGNSTPKNYFSKILKYDNLINETNSVTSVTDFSVFVEKFVKKLDSLPTGIYNVTNPQPVKAEVVVEILKKNGLENPNWNFIDVKDLNTVAKRSNCILDTTKIKSFGLELPNTIESIERDVKILAENYQK